MNTKEPDLSDSLEVIETAYSKAFRQVLGGCNSPVDIRIMCEHISDMAAILANSALAVSERFDPYIERAVKERSDDSGRLQKAALHLRQVFEVLGVVESLSSIASEDIGRAKPAPLP